MRNSFRTLYILPVLLTVLMAACSAPEDANSTNNNTAAPSPQNGPQTTNVGTAPVTTEPQQTGQLPPVTLPEPTTANGTPPAPPTSTGSAPKLVVPKTVIDFGKQGKEKSLARTIALKNTGNAELKIEAVEPS